MKHPGQFFKMKIHMLVCGILILYPLFAFSGHNSHLRPGEMQSMVVEKCLEIKQGPFQGKRKFCSDESKQVYTVIVNGNNVSITYSTVKIIGRFKNGLLLTNDPKEIEYRQYAKKHNYGKYYILKPNYFSVLNPENGEYSFYKLCK